MDELRSDPAWAWCGGRVVAFTDARVPIEDRGLQFGESLYEVIAVVRGEPFRLSDHVLRMENAAREIGIAAGVPGLERWKDMVAELYRLEPHPAAVLYAQVTGGAAARSHVPVATPEPFFFAYLRRYSFPKPAETVRGIAAVALPDSRWQRRDLKTGMLLPAVLARKDALARGAQEAIFVGQDGLVNEGAVSTVFAVHGRAVATPPANQRILEGISTTVVEQVCREAGVTFSARPLPLADLRKADEMFVASTTVLLMPVVRLDGVPVGGGVPGKVTLDLAGRFQKLFWGPRGPLTGKELAGMAAPA
jgi:D-alanine transaminase